MTHDVVLTSPAERELSEASESRQENKQVDWLHFSAACQFVDPDISFEWGTKYLYLVPKEVTRDKWDAYAEVCGAWKVPYREEDEPRLRFYVAVVYNKSYPDNGTIFSNMPWDGFTAPGRLATRGRRPNLSRTFRDLQQNMALLQEFLELYESGRKFTILQLLRYNELATDPFVNKWR